jgi:hypothetical protein
MTDEWMRDSLFMESKWQEMMSSYKPAMLKETCHLCDMSLKEGIKQLTSKERAIRKFRWKFNTASLLWASSGIMGALKDCRTRQFLDDVRECERLYGEYRYYDDLLWGWSGNQ